jgi:hypothetical protein
VCVTPVSFAVSSHSPSSETENLKIAAQREP